MSTTADIYYSNGAFLIFKNEHALILRKNRILGQLIGCPAKNPHQTVVSSLPYLISHYAAKMVMATGIGKFKRLVKREDISIVQNESKFSKRLAALDEEARKEFLDKRTEELAKRNIEIKPDRIGQFDESKMKLTVNDVPDFDYSTFFDKLIGERELASLLRVSDEKMTIFEDLYARGFYVNSGLKFGSDFLVYLGDPVRYHAQYAVRLVPSRNGLVDLTKISFNEINAQYRLCHNANKIPLFAVIHSGQVTYWTMKEREYLGPDSTSEELESTVPTMNDPKYSRAKTVDQTRLTPNKKIKF